jgi:hypothetical protein
MYVCMDGWMDGWWMVMDGCTHGRWMDGRMDGCMVDGWWMVMDGWMHYEWMHYG